MTSHNPCLLDIQYLLFELLFELFSTQHHIIELRLEKNFFFDHISPQLSQNDYKIFFFKSTYIEIC
jgi:hypothetical protein